MEVAAVASCYAGTAAPRCGLHNPISTMSDEHSVWEAKASPRWHRCEDLLELQGHSRAERPCEGHCAPAPLAEVPGTPLQLRIK